MSADLFTTTAHAAILSFIALFPMINPIGTSLIVEPFLEPLDDAERKRAARSIAINALCVCLVAILFGSAIFKLFGISVPAVQIAGGLYICIMGWGTLTSPGEDSADKDLPESRHRGIERMLFFPLTFPTTTGAGTISVILTLTANAWATSASLLQHALHFGAILLAAATLCALVFVCYNLAPAFIHRLSVPARMAATRLSGFMTLCVGTQILVNGILAVIRSGLPG